MAENPSSSLETVLVDESVCFTLVQLCQACRSDTVTLVELVREGVLEPAGSAPDDWQFTGPALRRARAALRLGKELELDIAGTALVLDLLDEIESLKSRLRRAGVR